MSSRGHKKARRKCNLPHKKTVPKNSRLFNLLRKFLAKLKNIETPWYNTFYKKEAQSLFSGKPEKVTGEIDYMVTNDLAMVLINIRDAAGTIVKSYFVSKGAMRGEYKYKLDWDVSKMTKGNYTVRVYENQRELKKLTIKLN